jgi:uncharacterized protein (UPF0305 family)
MEFKSKPVSRSRVSSANNYEIERSRERFVDNKIRTIVNSLSALRNEGIDMRAVFERFQTRLENEAAAAERKFRSAEIRVREFSELTEFLRNG